MYIALSGVDGSGKSSIGKMLEEELRDKFEKITFCDGIKPCIYSNLLRKTAIELKTDYFDYFQELSLIAFLLDLVNTYESKLKELLESQDILITHRNKLCCLTYSMLRDKNEKAIKIIDHILMGIPNPDFYFHLDVSAEVAMKRIEVRNSMTGASKSINERLELLEKLSDLYEVNIKNSSVPVYRFDTEKLSQKEIVNLMLELIFSFKESM